jgi:hypothetical protein
MEIFLANIDDFENLPVVACTVGQLLDFTKSIPP